MRAEIGEVSAGQVGMDKARLRSRLRTLIAYQACSKSPPDRTSQKSAEPMCLSILALRRLPSIEISCMARTLQGLQNKDGSWRAFEGDEPDGSWVTALAVIALLATGSEVSSLSRAICWLVGARGREASWFCRWRFQAADKSVRFDPAKYGWSWVPGTTSWVIPTAFSVIALRQVRNLGINRTAAVTERIEQGVSMLLDRMCPGGGWNAGNGMAFGVRYSAYIDATAIALLALAGHETESGVRDSLTWLVNRLPGCPSPYSLAWGILALAAYRNISNEASNALACATNQLTSLIDRGVGMGDVCTVAVCALALDAVEGDNVFEVRS